MDREIRLGLRQKKREHQLASWQIREEVRKTPELQHGSLLILDESADEKAGGQSVGASRQYNGRMGKVDECQVAVVLGYANLKVQSWPFLM